MMSVLSLRNPVSVDDGCLLLPSELSGLPSEADRLKELIRYECGGTATGETLDNLVALAATLFRVPISLVTLVGAQSQCFVGRAGLEIDGTPRNMSFCAHAIAADEILTVPDALSDPRFASNPLVCGEPNIRFYAGAPLVTPLGHRLGALCIIDRNPRALLTYSEKTLLRQLAAIAISHLDDRRRDREMRERDLSRCSLPPMVV